MSASDPQKLKCDCLWRTTLIMNCDFVICRYFILKFKLFSAIQIAGCLACYVGSDYHGSLVYHRMRSFPSNPGAPR